MFRPQDFNLFQITQLLPQDFNLGADACCSSEHIELAFPIPGNRFACLITFYTDLIVRCPGSHCSLLGSACSPNEMAKVVAPKDWKQFGQLPDII